MIWMCFEAHPTRRGIVAQCILEIYVPYAWCPRTIVSISSEEFRCFLSITLRKYWRVINTVDGFTCQYLLALPLPTSSQTRGLHLAMCVSISHVFSGHDCFY